MTSDGTPVTSGVANGSEEGVTNSTSDMEVGVGWSAMFEGGRSEGADGFSRVHEIAVNANSATVAHKTKRFIWQAPCQGTVPPGCKYYSNIDRGESQMVYDGMVYHGRRGDTGGQRKGDAGTRRHKHGCVGGGISDEMY